MKSNSATAARRALLQRIMTEGAEAGYVAALEVARDPKAQAPAKATAAGLLLRAAGLLESKREELKPKEPSDMSYDELNEAVEQLRVGAREELDGTVFD